MQRILDILLILVKVKKGFALILTVTFFFSSVIMPYGNFNDNYATRQVYDQQQRQDPDLNIGEFIFVKLLYIGQLFDTDEDFIPLQDLPIKDRQPAQPMQIQTGFLDCTKLVIQVEDSPAPISKPTCLFKDNMFSFEFHSSVFHPPIYLG